MGDNDEDKATWGSFEDGIDGFLGPSMSPQNNETSILDNPIIILFVKSLNVVIP